jgi:hypothetical protein
MKIPSVSQVLIPTFAKGVKEDLKGAVKRKRYKTGKK